MNSAIRDQRRILHVFLPVHEEISSYPMMRPPLFMNLFGVLLLNAFRRSIAIARKMD
jgi:hypothetical protein